MMKERVKEICDDMIFFWEYIKENKYKTLLVFIAFAFIVSLFFQFMLSIRMNLLEKSSYTDWISAFCNIVMAAAAVLVFIEAKKYLRKSASEDGFKVALSLLNDKLLKTALISDLQYKISALSAILLNYSKIDVNLQKLGQVDFGDSERKMLESLSKVAGEIDNILMQEIYVLNQNIQFDIFRMRNLGIDFKHDECGVIIKNHFNNFAELTYQLEGSIELLKSYLRAYCNNKQEDIFDITKISIPANSKSFRSDLPDINTEFMNVSVLIKKSRIGLSEITIAKKTIFDYFNLDD